MLDYITNFQFNSTLGIYLFWVPAIFCIVFYYVRIFGMYLIDKDNRETARQNRTLNEKNGNKELSTYYDPSLKLGMIIGVTIVSFIPIANIFCAVFDLAPKVFYRFFKLVDKLFDISLVPKD